MDPSVNGGWRRAARGGLPAAPSGGLADPDISYRIVELAEHDGGDARRVVSRFDSAYRAMEALRAAVLRGDANAERQCVVDPRGRILVRPYDVHDLVA